MAHHLLLLINLAGLLLLNTFFAADVSITQNLPATMAAGSEVRVTVTINKGDLSGFAKLQLDLPPGLTVNAIETKGASFTFADQKAKFIWMALPASPTFRISYTLSASATASGPQVITGRLSYIEDNERKTYDLPPATVDISPAPGTSSIGQAAPPIEDLASAAGGGATPGTPMPAFEHNFFGTPPMPGQGGISGTRRITPITEKEMLVEVTVQKGDIRGFGKLQETIPDGFTAVEKSSDEAIFTAQGRIVKFVWLNLPARPEVKVSYKLRANDRPDGEYRIDGEFGYLLNDETQKAVLGTSRFHIGERAWELLAQDGNNVQPVDATDPSLALREKQRTEEAARKEQEAAQAKAREEARAQNTPKPAPAPRVQGPERGVTYKVQITAAHREVGKPYFQARHRYSGDFQIERHQGWIKYVTGRFTEYREARDQRVRFVQAGHNFPGPFVTAYNNGERITVQEALAISNQTWVQ
jgi:hypothetical protein